MSKIPLVDLQAQYRSLETEMKAAVTNVMESCAFILGPDVTSFEKKYAEYCGSKHCIGVSSGTSALELALRAAGLQEGDEVITQANTFVASVLAVTAIGAVPILVDIDPETMQLIPEQVEKAITPKTKAILPVHIFGAECPLKEMKELCEKHSLLLVEDACQAHGLRLASFDGKKAGTVGKMGCFSFYPGKNLGAYGDGGAVITDDDALAEKIRLLRHFGSKVRYHHEILGQNARLDTIQAAVLNVKLPYLDDWNAKREVVARKYNEKLKGVGDVKVCDAFGPSVWHLYPLRTEKRDALMEYLKSKDVFCGVHYPIPISQLKCFEDLFKGKDMSLPVTDKAALNMISLPCYPEITDEQIDRVVAEIKNFFAQ